MESIKVLLVHSLISVVFDIVFDLIDSMFKWQDSKEMLNQWGDP